MLLSNKKFCRFDHVILWGGKASEWGFGMRLWNEALEWNTDTRNSRFTFCVHFTHQLFKKFFDTNHSGDPSKDTAYIMTIEGRAYPIDVHYLKRLVLCLSVCVD